MLQMGSMVEVSSINIRKIIVITTAIVGAGLTGRNGEDVYIKVPLGTIVSERLSEDSINAMVKDLLQF